MAERLKYLYTPELVTNIATKIKHEHKDFDEHTFVQSVFDNNWDDKELKQRMRHITHVLHALLPKNYQQALAILKPVSSQFTGFETMCFPDYVELYGLDYFEDSVSALAYFTQYSSSEFAVRPFIQRYGDKMMQQMVVWTQSDNEHIRRLATEGCRPRLPWAMALPVFKQDPTSVIYLLEQLKDDNSLYVRRSVANNLNDIAKDHPQKVADIAMQWLGFSKDRDWLVKHACRTLLKQAHPDVMTLFGFNLPDAICINNFNLQSQVNMGEKLHFSFCLTTKAQKLGKLRIEFAVDFMKKNGKQARKIFKVSESNYQEQTKKVEKYFSFKVISTRQYYVGKHGLAILVNGVELILGSFQLSL